VLLDLHFFKKT